MTFTNIIQRIKIEDPETYERIMNNYIKLKNQHKMKCIYYTAASKMFFCYYYHAKIYYLDHNPKECFGFQTHRRRQTKA